MTMLRTHHKRRRSQPARAARRAEQEKKSLWGKPFDVNVVANMLMNSPERWMLANASRLLPEMKRSRSGEWMYPARPFRLSDAQTELVKYLESGMVTVTSGEPDGTFTHKLNFKPLRRGCAIGVDVAAPGSKDKTVMVVIDKNGEVAK